MLRIREVQLRIESLYHLDEMKTPVHLCIGQEAVPVGVCANLNRDDYISSNHRGHGHYLAKGGNLNAMIAELYCKKTGCSRGRGGSMHLIDTSVGHLGSSSIVGGGVPIATGLGLAIKMKREKRISVAFLGDGAEDEGTLYESLNFAMLKKLPVVFVLENNQWSVCSASSSRHWGENIFHQAPPEKLLTAMVDGNDVVKVYETAAEAIDRARSGLGPSFIECVTYRMRGHAGSYSDAKLGYRTQEEIDSWEQKCPIRRLRERLTSESLITESEMSVLEREIEEEITAAFEYAQSSPLPDKSDVLHHVFGK